MGSYFLFLFREWLCRLKELWSWKGIVVIFISFYMIMDTMLEGESGAVNLQGIGSMWLVLVFQPHMGKLLYLLPFSKKERKRYLIMYTEVYWLFLITLCLLIGAIAGIFTGYSILLWIKELVVFTVPFLLAYSSYLIAGIAVHKDGQNMYGKGWLFSTRNCWHREVDIVSGVKEDCMGTENPGKKELSEEEKLIRRKRIVITIVESACMIMISIHAFFSDLLWMLFGRNNAVIAVGMLLAYAGVVIVVGIKWNRVAEELNNVGIAGKEACGCNL